MVSLGRIFRKCAVLCAPSVVGFWGVVSHGFGELPVPSLELCLFFSGNSTRGSLMDMLGSGAGGSGLVRIINVCVAVGEVEQQDPLLSTPIPGCSWNPGFPRAPLGV